MAVLRQALVAAAALAASSLTHAVGVINMTEVGANVVASGSGSFNTAALTTGSASASGLVWGGFAFGSILNVGGGTSPTSTALTVFIGISGPASFGTGARIFADQTTGDLIGLIANRQLQLPSGYASGTPLAGTATWLNQTFAGLSVNPGTYIWTWGSGPTADSLTLNIGVAPVPEPHSALLMLAGLAVGGAVWRRRRSAA